MFKKILPSAPCGARWKVLNDVHRAFCISLSGIIFFLITGCATLSPLPQVNLSEPGWAVRHGQAVWKRNQQAPEIAGEILLATRADGQVLVQFAKNPLPLVIAQRTTNSWQIESPMQGKRFSGRGNPPVRLLWLQLAGCVAGQQPRKPWRWKKFSNDRWKLENSITGEILEGYFNP
jgi:hypothetical protein